MPCPNCLCQDCAKDRAKTDDRFATCAICGYNYWKRDMLAGRTPGKPLCIGCFEWAANATPEDVRRAEGG